MIFSDDDNNRTEKDYEHMVLRRLRKYGHAVHIECGVPGFPDILAICNGNVFFVEMKRMQSKQDTPEKLLRPVQKVYHETLRDNGGIVYTVLAGSKEFRLYNNDEILCKGSADDVVEYIIKGFNGEAKE